MDSPCVLEKYGTSKNVDYSVKYILDGRLRSQKVQSVRSSSLYRRLKDAFLPQGYPDSVSEDYLEYQLWDTLQAFCSSITGTLATQAVLRGYGVGNQAASAVSATLTWLLKDGCGMCGRILFAMAKGSSLDCEAKRWRLVADIMNDVAICLEIVSQYVPSYFTAVVCISNLSKSIVGVAGGATRAAIVQHQAKRGNMADVSAKDGSQETLVNLTALVAGLQITALVGVYPWLTWVLFALFTILHLFSNYKAVSAVAMDTLSIDRIRLVMMEFLRSRRVLSPSEVARLEPILRARELAVSLSEHAGSREVLQAVASAVLIDLADGGHGYTEEALLQYVRPGSSMLDLSTPRGVMANADHWSPGFFKVFFEALDLGGWRTDQHHIIMDEWRYRGLLEESGMIKEWKCCLW